MAMLVRGYPEAANHTANNPGHPFRQTVKQILAVGPDIKKWTGHAVPPSKGLTDFGDKKAVKSFTGDKNANFNQYDFHHFVHLFAREGCGREARSTDFLQVLAVALKPFFWRRCDNMTRILYDISEMSCP